MKDEALREAELRSIILLAVRVLTYQGRSDTARDDIREHVKEIRALYNELKRTTDFTTAAEIAGTEWLLRYLAANAEFLNAIGTNNTLKNKTAGLSYADLFSTPALNRRSPVSGGSDYESERIRKSMDCEYCNHGWRDGMGAMPHPTQCTVCNTDGRVPRSPNATSLPTAVGGNGGAERKR